MEMRNLEYTLCKTEISCILSVCTWNFEWTNTSDFILRERNLLDLIFNLIEVKKIRSKNMEMIKFTYQIVKNN